MDLNNYLNDAMLEAAVSRDNTARIYSLRQNIPFTFAKHTSFNVSPNLNAVITNADNSVAAATVQSFDSEGKLQARGTISELNLSKYPITHARQMKEKEILNLSHSLKLSDSPETIILKSMYDDKTANDLGILERFEDMYLQLLSNEGVITLNATNNLDGLSTTIDYNISPDHKKQAAVKWSTTGTADPIADINTVLEAAHEEGIYPDTIFMDMSTFTAMKATDAFKSLYVTYVGNGVTARYAGIDQVNEFFTGVGLPTIEIITDAVRVVNGAGNKVKANSWNSNFVSFGTSGQHGNIDTATAPDDLFKGRTDVVWKTDTKTGIMNIVKSSLDPMEIKQTGKVFGLVNLPKVYDMFYLEIEF